MISSGRPGKPRAGGDFEAWWTRALHDGVIAGSAVRGGADRPSPSKYSGSHDAAPTPV